MPRTRTNFDDNGSYSDVQTVAEASPEEIEQAKADARALLESALADPHGSYAVAVLTSEGVTIEGSLSAAQHMELANAFAFSGLNMAGVGVDLTSLFAGDNDDEDEGDDPVAA